MSILEKLNLAAEKAGAPKKHTGGIGDILISKIDDHLNTQNEIVFTQKTGFQPSDTINCSRRSVYLLRGVDVDTIRDPRIRRVFDNGHAVHSRIVGYAEDAGILVSEEHEGWWEDPPMHYYIDMIVNLNDELVPVEIKSASETVFENRKIYNKPKDDHRTQLCYYLYFNGYTKGIVLYECKNNQELLAFEITLDRQEIEKVLNKKRKAYADYLAGILPKRPAKSPDSQMCQYCELKPMCWEGWPNNLAP